MNAIVIEHVKVEELPLAWRAKLASPTDATVTVRIEEEAGNQTVASGARPHDASDDPLFGMWADRTDMADVPSYIRGLRAGFNSVGSCRTGEDGTAASPSQD
jgi:hypothetical protein